MADALNWCADGSTQAHCVRYHVRAKLPAARPASGQDRQCPVSDCGGNLSVNVGTKGMWVVWCCGGGCPPEAVRDAMPGSIAAKCLGSLGSDSWLAKQAKKAAKGATSYPSNRADSATYAAASRSYAMAKLAGAEITNGSLLRMCIQAIAESDGSVSGDPELLLPRDHADFIALAARTGIERCHRYRLASRYLSK